MANKHNLFSQLLGGAENDPQPLIGAIPMAGVPDLGDIASSMENMANFHADGIRSHADAIRKVAQFQPKFDPERQGGIDG